MLEVVITFLILIFALFVALIPFTLALSFIFGPPYLPTPKNVVKEMLELAEVDEKDILADLGSGDGVVLIEGALRGAIVRGYEINLFLVLLTKLKTRMKGLGSKITVQAMPYQKANLENTTVVFCYNMPRFMPAIEKKLRKEASKNVKVLSYRFPLPKLKLIERTSSGIFLHTLKD